MLDIDRPGSLLSDGPFSRYALAAAIGLGASTVHWLGLLLGGMLVGWVAPTVRRGVLYGALFGVGVWVVFALTLAYSGILPTTDAGQIFGLSAVIPIVLGGLGGSVRELRPLLEGVTPWSDG